MKKIIFITIAFISLTCNSQTIVEANELTINGINIIRQNESVLISNFGNPIEIEKSFSEMDNTEMYLFKYDGIIFYVKENKIDDYEITNSKYAFTNHNIRIGDSIDKLKTIYPLSFKQIVNEHMTLWINGYDKYVSIHFSIVTKEINLIRIGTY